MLVIQNHLIRVININNLIDSFARSNLCILIFKVFFFLLNKKKTKQFQSCSISIFSQIITKLFTTNLKVKMKLWIILFKIVNLY